MDGKDLKIIAQVALDEFMKAREIAKNCLIEIVKAHGNFIPLIPDGKKLDVFLMKSVESYDCSQNNSEMEQIFGLRYVEGEGLFVCTETCLENYEYDNEYDFFSFVEPDEGDIQHMNKALEDLAYYISFDEDYIIKSTSLISILASIVEYL